MYFRIFTKLSLREVQKYNPSFQDTKEFKIRFKIAADEIFLKLRIGENNNCKLDLRGFIAITDTFTWCVHKQIRPVWWLDKLLVVSCSVFCQFGQDGYCHSCSWCSTSQYGPRTLVWIVLRCLIWIFNYMWKKNHIRSFPKLYPVGNVANTALRREEQDKISQKNASSGDRTQNLWWWTLMSSLLC